MHELRLDLKGMHYEKVYKLLNGFINRYVGTGYKIEICIGQSLLVREEAKRVLKDMDINYFICGPYRTLDDYIIIKEV